MEEFPQFQQKFMELPRALPIEPLAKAANIRKIEAPTVNHGPTPP
jgi:hypothetical protein